jgi:RNA polymerase sigma-70 factor (ECF subfamily)
MLLHDSRREARVDRAGDLVVLEDQDRSLWNRAQIAEALPLVSQAIGSPQQGPFSLQAAIVAEHCKAASAEETDWKEIAGLYDRLERIQPSPVVSLNRAVAVAMAETPERGLELIDEIAAAGQLNDYHLLHAARADLLRRMGSHEAAAASYSRALELTNNAAEKRFLTARLEKMESAAARHS